LSPVGIIGYLTVHEKDQFWFYTTETNDCCDEWTIEEGSSIMGSTIPTAWRVSVGNLLLEIWKKKCKGY
jgi:hypothetical protein